MRRANESDPAKYAEPITIQKIKASAEANAHGEVDLEDDANWELHFACWAAIFPRGAREFTIAGILDADVAHMLDVPRSSATEAITSRMRILWGEAKLQILAAFPKKTDRREIELHTRY